MKVSSFKSLLTGLFFFCCFPLNVIGQTPNSLSVAGRVVDQNGAPAANALVYLLNPSCTGCWDRIIPTTKTSEEGLFAMPIESKVGSNVTVFVEQEVPNGFWSPFFADDRAFAKAGVHGIPVRVQRRSGTIQLGDVRPAVEYKTVNIDIRNLFPSDTAEKVDFDCVRLTISLEKAVIYKDIRLPPSAEKLPVVHLALPKGHSWKVVFSVLKGGTRISKQVLVSWAEHEPNRRGV